MTYYDVMRGVENIFNLRLAMVTLAREKGISEAARQYQTTRTTVRKWLRRHKEQGLSGLEDRSRAPKRIPHKTPKALEDRVIELRKSHPAWGPERLKMHYELPMSTKAIARIIRQVGLVRRKKRKWKKQRDLREVKKQLRPFQLIGIDVKDLRDIEKYRPQMMRLHLPRYQFTARDVGTGGCWYAYGRTKESTNAAIFASYLLSSLKHYGVDMKGVTIQTDNGSEFIGSVHKRGESAFKEVLNGFGVRHCRIPPMA
ncbi:MAG: helix-turn-helix domain-containing protein, partial [candidate division KSB1 bacterium]|nr:helix-turn-helix domain-containing protein [candidate division KSB1 bacterium]